GGLVPPGVDRGVARLPAARAGERPARALDEVLGRGLLEGARVPAGGAQGSERARDPLPPVGPGVGPQPRSGVDVAAGSAARARAALPRRSLPIHRWPVARALSDDRELA